MKPAGNSSCQVSSIRQQLTSRSLGDSVSGHLGPGNEPYDEHDDGEDDSPEKAAGSKWQGVCISKKIRDIGQVEACNVVDVTLARLRLGERLVLGNDAAEMPAREFADDSNDTASPVLYRKSVKSPAAVVRTLALTLPWLQWISKG